VARFENTVPLTVALVGCGKQKLEVRAKARDLYAGRLFRMSYEHAERTSDDVLILSAKHGVISPFKEIDPYDLSINQMLIHHKHQWARWVISELIMLYPLTRLRIVFYAGQAYIRPILAEASEQEAYWDFCNPLEGLDLFERMAWFKAHKEEAHENQ